MAYTREQALNHVIGKGFSHQAAKAILSKLSPQEVFDGGGAASAQSGEAMAHVKSFGYSDEAAQRIVQKVEPHIVLAHKELDDDSSATHSFWDADLGGEDIDDDDSGKKSKSTKGGPSKNQ
ncbi:MAG: hypothetical protein ACRD4O_04120 [Bryobacteraceae bacterium]